MYKAEPHIREYPVLGSHTIEIITKAGQSRYNIPDADFLRNKIILGAFVRQQADGNTRKSKNGYALIPNTVLDVAYLILEVDAKRVVNDHPLAHMVHERGVSAPGDYLQLYLNKGFDPSTSLVRFTDAANITDDKAVEIVFIYSEPEDVCHV